MRRGTAFRMAGVLGLFGSLLATPVNAHVGGLSGAAVRGSIPSWLTVATGGVIIGASFLFTSLLTDEAAIEAVNASSFTFPSPDILRAGIRWLGGVLGVVVLALVVASGLLGPRSPTANFAILVVWAGWWAGYTMSVYLLGNSWPVLNPWRAIATVLWRMVDVVLPWIERRSYPDRLGVWPSVVGLLGLVFVEVVTDVAEDPRFLAGLILVYTLVTVGGALLFGVETWFGTVDPVSRVFYYYGRVAPIQRTREGIELRFPTTPLTDGEVPERNGEVAFVIALLWSTTYDGLVSTPSWAGFAEVIVEGIGVPPLALYFVAMIVGFLVFYWTFAFAARKGRETADTYVTAGFLKRWFVPSLLPIAAGYHVAHFLGYFLSLLPTLGAVLTHPFSTAPTLQAFVLPGWFGLLQLGFVLLGHLLAVWVAHALSFDLFPGILSPIRSQYPFVIVMIGYTMISMWIIGQPFGAPPYL